MMRQTLRRSRRSRRCETGSHCCVPIQPGDQYIEMVASPDHGDIGNVGWWRIAECIGCATLYDRQALKGNR